MTSEPQASNDLSRLIDQAENLLNQKALVAQKAGKKVRLPLTNILAGLLAAGLAYVGYFIWSNIAPPTKEQVAHDLETVVDQAKELIDEAKTADGAPPEGIPSAALASVVRYEVEDNHYKLVASARGVRVSIDHDGKKTTEIGME